VENKDEQISIDDRLIVRYLTGEALPEEAMAMHSWLEVVDNRLYFEKFETAWNRSSSKKAHEPDAQRAWVSILENLKAREQDQDVSVSQSKSSWTLRIAASIVLITASAATIFFINRGKQENVKLLVTADEGITREFQFSDSSLVILNKNASVSYPDIFNRSTREVELTNGEAFFKIAKDKSKPFIIHTRIADIKVVGTEFNVILENDKLIVSVVEGRVLVITKNDSKGLEAGDLAQIRSNTDGIQVGKFENANDLAYATHSFVFNDVALSEVFQHIEKSYPYFINVSNKDIENCKLTATFENVTADKMVALIAQTLNLKVTKNENHFTIEGKGCP
jgi:transmembrane sensor